jgi:hypothetical protein
VTTLAELERIRGRCKGVHHNTVATLFHIVPHCSIKTFEISVGAAAPTSYNVASPLGDNQSFFPSPSRGKM